ncbi:hypothetical protein QCN29_27280 [Streptomyces sp. HNM0663]|uniref:DUF3137 domain-containing protein n=1 Tax=Streptomyces chengmaiensis TaxID=3040919 RepID=A0ABT6HUM2_9ACTN|nr:hypothetical protein [Streptomyces chengmaiensis]MDH2392414.1 hypothetical protein [Streptomyces chengmaiensis]
MISEPELVSEDGYGQAELPGEHRESAGADRETMDAERPVRRMPPWVWALAGAVGASALWAGGLYAYDRMGPDLGGYRATENLCEEAELSALTGALGQIAGASPQSAEHRVLDRAMCHLELRPADYEPMVDEDGNTYDMTPSASVTYELHKKADPETEFEATVAAPLDLFIGEKPSAKKIEGLGERAHLLSDGADARSLVVLDGQARLSLSVSPGYAESGEMRPDLSTIGIEKLLVDDMKALMERLKRPA